MCAKTVFANMRILGLIAGALLLVHPPIRAGDVWIESEPHPDKGLEGRRMVIDASHGRTWNDGTQTWAWERPVLFGEVEDLITPRIVNRWLIPYFQNAGAYVYTVRERDEQVRELRLDDNLTSGDFEPVGDWQEVSDSGAFNESARVAPTQPDSNGPIAVWSADFPATDRYGLCLWYPAVDEPTTATYVVHAAAGDVILKVNQRVNTSRWLWIDWFVFAQGRHPVVTLTTVGNEPGTVVVADGVRLGGGMGDADFGGGPSGLPRWQEYSKSYAMLYGAPPYIWDFPVAQHDYSIRYPFMHWLNGDFEFMLHTNSDATGGGTASGTTSVAAYARNEQEGQQLIQAHRRVTQLIKEHWLSTWRDRGDPVPEIYDYFAQPRWLIELAFHDRLDPDLVSLLDPDFRSIAARGIYEGIGAMLGGDDFVPVPEPPQAPSMRNLGQGRVELRWLPPAWGETPATYRVFLSDDALAFDQGTDVGNVTEYVIDNLSAGQVLYARIAAENDGGRSFPTETVGVRVGDSPTVLVVNGFDRLDRYVQEPDNPRRFVKEHIEALAADRPGIAIDSTSNDAVVSDRVPLADYTAVDWILGRESIEDETFSADEQQRVSAYVENGGRLLVTGTDIGYDLYHNFIPSNRVFANDRLHIEFVNHDIRMPHADGAAGMAFEGFACDVATTSGLPYDAREADTLSPVAGAYTVLNWAEGGAAGIAFATGPGKTLVLATPLEAVRGESVRADLANRALTFLLDPLEPDSTPPNVIQMAVTNILAREARVSWTTDEITVAEADFGLDGVDFGSHAGPTTSYVRIGGLPLTGLLPDTTYQVRIRARDYAGNETVSTVRQFTTLAEDTTPPSFTGMHAYRGTRWALICVTTDENARCELQYRLTPQDPWLSIQGPGYTLNSCLGINQLEPDTWYHYRVRAEDIQGNERYTSESIFLTRPVDQTPPRIDYIRVLDVSDRDAMIAWQTDDPATSQVEWWSDPTTRTLAPLDTTVPVAHFYHLEGLTTSTLIHFQVISRNAEGLESRGPEMTFQTLANIADVVVDNSDPGFSVEGTWAYSTMAPERRWGEDYRWKAVKYAGDDPVFATWQGTLPRAGMWQAHCWYVTGPNRAGDTPYYVRHPGGEEVVRVDQLNDGGVFFHPIGRPRSYPAGTAEIAVSNDATTGNVVIADAVMWAFENLGSPFHYRFLLPRSLELHILDAWPLDADLVPESDPNNDGVADVADLIRLRTSLQQP